MRALLISTLVLLVMLVGAIPGVAGKDIATIIVRSDQFRTPVNATGLLVPFARVAVVPFQGSSLAIAMDADAPAGKYFSRVRLDFTGTSNFTAATALEIRARKTNSCDILAGDFTLTLGGRTLPVRISGSIALDAKRELEQLTLILNAETKMLGSVMTNPGRNIEIYVQPEQFTKPVKTSGLNAPIAQIATVPFQGGLWAIAVDADTPQGTTFSRLRLDYTGTGNFTPENSLELKERFKGATVQDCTIKLGDRTFPVRMTVDLRGDVQHPWLNLSFSYQVQASCVFGNKTHSVTILDTNHNWHLGDAYPVITLPQRGNQAAGDRILIDPDARTGPTYGWYDHPIKVDGQWYQIAIAPDALTVTATPYAGPLGLIDLKSKNCCATLIGTKYMVTIYGHGQPQSIPVDEYHLVDYGDNGKSSLWGIWTQDGIRIDDWACTVKPFTIQAHAITVVDPGSSVIARVSIKQQGRDLIFSVTEATSTGYPVKQCEGGYQELGLLKNVPFVVTDAQGNKVYENTFECG